VFWFSARLAKATTLVQPASPLPHRAAEDELRARYAGARILLADDEPVHQEVTRILLEEAGMKVDSVGDGAQAVELSAAMDYDLILMDLRMPKLSGIEATQLIRALPGRSTTPILALTASVFGKDSESCLVAGMNDFVAKPVAPEALYALILKWLSHDSVAAQPKSE